MSFTSTRTSLSNVLKCQLTYILPNCNKTTRIFEHLHSNTNARTQVHLFVHRDLCLLIVWRDTSRFNPRERRRCRKWWKPWGKVRRDSSRRSTVRYSVWPVSCLCLFSCPTCIGLWTTRKLIFDLSFSHLWRHCVSCSVRCVRPWQDMRDFMYVFVRTDELRDVHERVSKTRCKSHCSVELFRHFLWSDLSWSESSFCT